MSTETMNATRPPEPPPFSPRFLIGALVLTLTLGAGSIGAVGDKIVAALQARVAATPPVETR